MVLVKVFMQMFLYTWKLRTQRNSHFTNIYHKYDSVLVLNITSNIFKQLNTKSDSMSAGLLELNCGLPSVLTEKGLTPQQAP